MQHFALIGNPVNHSKSPRIHQLFATQSGIQLSYQTWQLEPAELSAAIMNFKGVGLNVTQPYKQQAFKLVDELTPRARRAQALNTIYYKTDGKRYGDNTDGIGLVTDIIRNKNFQLSNKQILLLGAGGAARGILGPLIDESPARLVIANRDPLKAQALAAAFPLTEAISLDDINKYTYDLIINAANFTVMPSIQLTGTPCCYDLSYARDTPFQQWVSRQGFITWDGLGMLVEQAAAAFFLWHKFYPDTKSVLAHPDLF
jgi:shikimate dehydrogenase